jgi:hypothetical protein
MPQKTKPTPQKADSAEKSNGNSREVRVKRLTPHRFKPGQSGNPGGRPKKQVTAALERELNNLVPGDSEKRTWLQLMVQGAIKKAVKGDMKAFAEIIDRLEGKAMQAHELSGPGGGAITVQSHTPQEREKRISELLAKAGKAL